MAIGNGLAAAALCLDGQHMVSVEHPIVPHPAPPKVKIHHLRRAPIGWKLVQVRTMHASTKDNLQRGHSYRRPICRTAINWCAHCVT